MNKIILLLSIMLFCFFSCSKETKKKAPLVENGILDLRTWDLEKDGPVKLDGQWKFFWEKFVPPEQIDKYKKYSLIEVPASWNKKKSNKNTLSIYGYGTYHVKILLNPKNKVHGLRIHKIFSAYKCFINNELVKSVGKISTNHDSMLAKVHPGIVVVYDIYKELNIVIHTSNFHYKISGISFPISYGKPESLYKFKENIQKEEFFVFGIFFIMFLYHFGLFLLRTSEKLPLIFGILCFLVSVRVLSMGEMGIMDFFPSLNLDWQLTIEYLTFYLSILFFIYFLRICFPDEFNRIVLRIFSIFAIIYSLLTIFTSADFFSFILKYFQIISLLIIVYSIIVIILALFRKREGAAPLFFGLLAAIIVTLNDILYSKLIINTGYIFYYGLLILIFCQSYMLSIRFTNAEKKLEEKSIALEKANKYKTKFLANMSHELRTPLNSINGIIDLLRFGSYEKSDKIIEEMDEAIKQMKQIASKKVDKHEIDQLIIDLESAMKFISNEGNLKEFLFTNSIGKLERMKDLEKINDINKKLVNASLHVKKEEEEIYNSYNRIKEAGDHLLALIDEILNFSQLEQGKITINKKEINLKNMIKNTLNFFDKNVKILSKENQIKLNYSIDDSVPDTIKIDEKNTIIILKNIIENAIHFTEKGEILIKVNKDKTFIRFSILDPGIGIKEEDKDKIFIELESKSRQRGEEGKGLGLATAKKLVELQEGRIGFESKHGKGSTFWFELPI